MPQHPAAILSINSKTGRITLGTGLSLEEIADGSFRLIAEVSPSDLLALMTEVLNDAPQTLPAEPGVIWNNGGYICLS